MRKGEIKKDSRSRTKYLASGHGVIAAWGRVRKEKNSHVYYCTAGCMHNWVGGRASNVVPLASAFLFLSLETHSTP